MLAEERSSTFTTRRLSIRACSPTWTETSRIDRSYEEMTSAAGLCRVAHGAGIGRTSISSDMLHWEKRAGKHLQRPRR